MQHGNNFIITSMCDRFEESPLHFRIFRFNFHSGSLSRCVIWMEKRRRDGNKFYKNFPVFVASSVPCFHDDREIRKNNKGFKDTKD